MLTRIHRLSKQRNNHQENEYGEYGVLCEHCVDTHDIKSSMMARCRDDHAKQNDGTEHSADYKWPKVSEYGADKLNDEFLEIMTEKKQYQERANEQCGDHVIYSLATMLKPLLENCKFEVT